MSNSNADGIRKTMSKLQENMYSVEFNEKKPRAAASPKSVANNDIYIDLSEENANMLAVTLKGRTALIPAERAQKIAEKLMKLSSSILSEQENEAPAPEEKPVPTFSEGDFVKDRRGNVYKVFEVLGTTLKVAPYYGGDSFGGMVNAHVTKVSMASRDDISEELTIGQINALEEENLEEKDLGVQNNFGIEPAEKHTKYDPPQTGNKKVSARAGFVG